MVTLKHWDAYSLEDADGFTRHNFDAKISPFELADTYWCVPNRLAVLLACVLLCALLPLTGVTLLQAGVGGQR